ncbi:putative transcriptional regulator [Bradyrhizobium japonicum]|uniref:Transcriptional regulator n=1 Tax=Bradyrhizobium japonicum TaxID=375 RepID=A0ABV2RR49_BRAJP|nr:winged helix-turn-helix domain-containing protein [Bradyrhizobium japonicum]UQD97238.1 winged helix-turn-helix transcriptional regulator [Bradyrhizobium japonicum]WLB17353.1 winged helix-turn-helix domain-containing protein [Bradyrhizobium japonicum]
MRRRTLDRLSPLIAPKAMVLDRNQSGAKLYGRGRDAEEYEVAMQFDDGLWTVLGDASDVAQSEKKRRILAALRCADASMSPSDIAKEAGIKSGTVSTTLARMAEEGLVQKYGFGVWRAIKIAA